MTAPSQPRKRPAHAGHTTHTSQTNSQRALERVRDEARHCKACPLWANATQTVFGEGDADAAIMLVGEQPGDQEDIAGHPFVGPAGRVLDRALVDAGIARGRLYVTNAVKHFKFEPRGKRRMHKKPSDAEIGVCHQWLAREIALVAPKLIVAMGASAARALLGRATAINANRGRLLPFADSAQLLITVHPSFLLRVPDDDKASEFSKFVEEIG